MALTKPESKEFTHLTSILREMPRKRTGFVRSIWPTLRACLDAGHTLRDIHARLELDGVRMHYSTFCAAVASLRNDAAASRPLAAPTVAASRAEVGLENLKRLSQSRPGFSYSGTLPDEELFGRK
jgi:hypothetical protein